MLKSVSKRRVLVVDDDPVFQRIAQSALAEAGFDTISAGDVPAAQAIFDRLDAESLACVLIDYGLPGCDGIELIEWLNHTHPTLAAVMVTASPEHWLLERSLRARVCGFLGKPLAPSEIRRAVAGAANFTTQRRAFSEMRHQVEHAAMIQRAKLDRMLRRGDVSIEYRFHPLHYASGDFLGYHRLPGGEDVFLMSDTAGHDLRSSNHSSFFHGMLSGLLRSGRPLPEALNEYNGFLMDQPAGEVSSVAVSALEVHRDSGCVSAWNYGGPPPVFVDWEGWVRTIGTRASSPLGWFEDSKPTVDRVSIPRGPVWMWTDGVEDLAERLDASPLSVACALLQVHRGEPPEFLPQAGDDVLVARIWPGLSSGAVPPEYVQPLVAEEYAPKLVESIDRLQQRWTNSLQLALPGLSASGGYDLVLCAREAVLNALKHGCSDYDTARFQILYEPSRGLLRVRVSDPGPGHHFDLAQQAARDLCDPVESHRGLLLMNFHATRVSTARDGADVTMEFQLGAGTIEKTSQGEKHGIDKNSNDSRDAVENDRLPVSR